MNTGAIAAPGAAARRSAPGSSEDLRRWAMGETQVSHNQNHASRRRISAAISGWDRPLLTFTYPGFDCGSSGESCVLRLGLPTWGVC